MTLVRRMGGPRVATGSLDIVIPIYHEQATIERTLRVLQRDIPAPFCVLLCYDDKTDPTLAAVRAMEPLTTAPVYFVPNQGRGPLAAIRTGLAFSTASHVLIAPADDDYNGPTWRAMLDRALAGADLVIASRFMPGGMMQRAPWLKGVLVRLAGTIGHRLLGLPSHDVTNGLCLVSRRLLRAFPIRSRVGFAYTLEWLVKCHRHGWPVAEVPARWFPRWKGTSRFRMLRWTPQYLVWMGYTIVTRLRGQSVPDIHHPDAPPFIHDCADLSCPVCGGAQVRSRLGE